MNPDLERLLSEDEAARAGVEEARARAEARLQSVRAGLAARRSARLAELRQDVDRSVAQSLAEVEREAERRRTQRAVYTQEEADRAGSLVDRGVEAWMDVVRKGPAPRGSS